MSPQIKFSSGLIFAALFAVSSAAASDKNITCWDGSTANASSDCPPEFSQGISCYFGPENEFILVSGLSEYPVTVTFGRDAVFTNIWFSIETEDGHKTRYNMQNEKLDIESGKIDPDKPWIFLSSQVETFTVKTDPSNAFNISNSGGARMVRLECIFNGILGFMNTKTKHDYELTLNCGR